MRAALFNCLKQNFHIIFPKCLSSNFQVHINSSAVFQTTHLKICTLFLFLLLKLNFRHHDEEVQIFTKCNLSITSYLNNIILNYWTNYKAGWMAAKTSWLINVKKYTRATYSKHVVTGFLLIISLFFCNCQSVMCRAFQRAYCYL